MSNLNQRHVHKLHLTAPDENLVRCGARLLEDALHTASLPGAMGGRVLIIRRLNVGRIDPNASSTTLALTLEARLRTLGTTAVYALHPSAENAAAVYFVDEAEPVIALARKLARGERPSAWFWPRVVPGWQPAMDQHQALRWLLIESTRSSLGIAATVRLVDVLHRENLLSPLLNALSEVDGAPLLALVAWSQPLTQPEPTWVNRAPTLSPAWQAVLLHWDSRWGSTDLRLRWLAAVALAAENPIRLLDRRNLTRQADQVLHTLAVVALPVAALNEGEQSTGMAHAPAVERNRISVERISSERLSVEPNETVVQNPFARQPTVLIPEATAIAEVQPDQFIKLSTTESTGFEPGTSEHPLTVAKRLNAPPGQVMHDAPLEELLMETTEVNREIATEPVLFSYGEFYHTDYAGLLFLIPVLMQLGLVEWLQHNPTWIERRFPFLLLGFIAHQLGAPPDDPMLRLFADELGDEDDGTDDGEPMVEPAIWQQLFEDEPVPLPNDALGAWFHAVEQWLKRYTVLTLVEVVQRPGRVTATPTHIDLFFDLNQLDIRIRRAGLDIDPGWVVWLGRVVQFHYVDEKPVNRF